MKNKKSKIQIQRDKLNKEVLKILNKIKIMNKGISNIGIFVISKKGDIRGADIKAFKNEVKKSKLKGI